MRHLLFSLIGLLASHLATAQQISRVNFDSVRVATTGPRSPLAYATLLRRFQAADTTLTPREFTYLYYGQVYAKQYHPYGSSQPADFRTLYQQEKFQEAIPVGEKLLAASPLDISLLFNLLVCHHMLGNKAQARRYAHQYFPLVQTIMASGDGKSVETAYVVAVVHDEYAVMRELGLRVSAQALLGHTDRLTATPVGGEGKPTGGAEQLVYFDISKPFGSLGSLLKQK